MALWPHAFGLNVASGYTDQNGVFKNKLRITDQLVLQQMEYELVAQRSIELESGEIELEVSGFGLARQRVIHTHLFQDLYDWAGQVRTVPSSKRMSNGLVSRFAEPGRIVEEWQDLEKMTATFIKNLDGSLEQMSDVLAEVFVKANQLHAFVEGNGRSLQVFMKQLALERGVSLDYSKVSPSEWNIASAVSGHHGRFFEHIHFMPSLSDSAPIKKIFSEISSLI